MQVLIDADGCPVVDIAIRVCQTEKVPCLILCDTSHMYQTEYAQVLVLDKGSDSVDYAIANRVQKGDIVITQDYGLASLCLARNAFVIHQDGWEYTTAIIDGLLAFRHEAFRQRKRKHHFHHIPKRNQLQNTAFETAFHAMLLAQKQRQG